MHYNSVAARSGCWVFTNVAHHYIHPSYPHPEVSLSLSFTFYAGKQYMVCRAWWFQTHLICHGCVCVHTCIFLHKCFYICHCNQDLYWIGYIHLYRMILLLRCSVSESEKNWTCYQSISLQKIFSRTLTRIKSLACKLAALLSYSINQLSHHQRQDAYLFLALAEDC